MGVHLYDLVGFTGAAVLIAAYFANQQGQLPSDDWRFPSANLAGSVLIFVSLLFTWNLPSVVIEIFWAAISIWGIIRSLSRR
ncbi:MAG: hypothetical protein JO001_26765 [Alphaproteobacteria bacterium]|nr:hypothetical protein [Alphaproteobacteria bacterium]